MRKQIAFALAVVLLFSLVACSGAPSVVPDDTATTTEATTVATESTTEPTTIPQETTAPTEPEANDQTFNTSGVIEETVLYDENSLKITATSLTYDSYRANLEVIVENNSDEEYKFITGSLGYSCTAINGWMVQDGYMNCTVAPNKKAKETIHYSFDELAMYGIHEIADITISFEVEDTSYDSIYTPPFTIKTNLAESHNYVEDTYRSTINAGSWGGYGANLVYYEESNAFDYNGVRILSSALVTNKDNNSVLLLEFENYGDETRKISCSDIRVNNCIIESGTWDTTNIVSGSRAVIGMVLDNMLDEELWPLVGMDTIGNVKVMVSLRDDNYDDIGDPVEIDVNIPDVSMTIDTSGDELFSSDEIRVIYKDIIDEAGTFHDDIHIVLLIENLGNERMHLTDEYKTFSVNGFMCDTYCPTTYIYPGEYAFFTISIDDRDKEDVDITSIADITEWEITLYYYFNSYSSRSSFVVSHTY